MVSEAMLGRRRTLLLVAFVPLLLGALALDPLVHDLAFRFVVGHEARLAANGFTQLGTAWSSGGLLGALALAGYRGSDAGLVRAAAGGLVGVALGSLSTHVLKNLVCRGRPGLLDGWGVGPPPSSDGGAAARVAAWGSFRWPCLGDSRYHSFPSGHATAAFALAGALVLAVPSRWALWLLVAAGVSASRLLLNAHFLSDVVAGAILGWWAARLGSVLVRRAAIVLVGGSPGAPSVGSGRAAGVTSA
jgi:membrane-associated phospholipid phosphatase